MRSLWLAACPSALVARCASSFQRLRSRAWPAIASWSLLALSSCLAIRCQAACCCRARASVDRSAGPADVQPMALVRWGIYAGQAQEGSWCGSGFSPGGVGWPPAHLLEQQRQRRCCNTCRWRRIWSILQIAVRHPDSSVIKLLSDEYSSVNGGHQMCWEDLSRGEPDPLLLVSGDLITTMP